MAGSGAGTRGGARRLEGPVAGRRARRLEGPVAAAIVLLPLALVLARCALDPAIPFISQRARAPWIMAPSEVTAELHQWGQVEAPVTTFSRRFEAPDPLPSQVLLHLRALGSARVFLNGRELSGASGPASRGRAEHTLDVGAELRPGENELRVEVANARGPALLSLASGGLPEPLATGDDWSVRDEDRTYARALVADDTRLNPLALAVETPAEAVAEKSDTLLLLFVLGAVGFWLAQRRLGDRAPAIWCAAAPLGASLAWLFLFFAKTARIPAGVGFDARHHLHYLQLLQQGQLPLATDGWSTYHPPLFYAASAAVARVAGEGAALKALPLLAGLGCVWIAWLLVRRLEPQRPELAGFAALFAAVLPVGLYSASYFSNEAFHACLANAALAAAALWLLADGPSWRRWLLAALLFGLAALAKFTVLVTLPVALFFAGWKLLSVDRLGPGRTAAALGAWAGVFLLVAGWFYARNLVHFGTPVLGNWSLPGEGRIWWVQPGFHTLTWYAGFGEVLVHPYLAGFHSFWDSVYSTFWGDGFIAGRVDPQQRHDFWDYGFMSAGYWVALPASALLLLGGVLLLREALGEGSPRRRLALGFLLTCVWAVSLAFFALTLQLPFFAQAKAAYLVMCTAPLALAFARGFAALDGWLGRRGGSVARAVLYGWLALFAGTLFLGFAA